MIGRLRSQPLTAAALPLLACVLLAPAAVADGLDPRVAWLLEHALPVASVDPAVVDFSDLEPLRERLAGVRVVLLGEASHGDGSALLAKTRLLRFLHQEMGFDVLALDGGFYELDRAGRRIRAGGDAREALREALPWVYTDAAEIGPLVELVAARAKSQRPLAVAGFDNQLYGEDAARQLVADLRGQLSRLGVQWDEIPGLDEAARILVHLGGDAYYTGESLTDRRARGRFTQTLEHLAARFAPAAAGGDEEASLWRQLLASLGNHAEGTWRLARWDPQKRLARGAPHYPPEIQNLRYRQLAENLLWLIRERYPGRKVVVWSTTLHLTRDLDRLTTGEADTRERFDRFKVPGDDLAAELGNEAYLLAFTALAGSKGRALLGREPSPLLVPTAGSFEDLMGATGLAAAIVDLRGLPEGGGWLKRSLIARPISHKELLGIWPRHVDGLFFLREMAPARRTAASGNAD